MKETPSALPDRIMFSHTKHYAGVEISHIKGYDIDSIDLRERAIAERLKDLKNEIEYESDGYPLGDSLEHLDQLIKELEGKK